MATILVEQIHTITVIHIVGKLSFHEIGNVIEKFYSQVTCHVVWDLTEGDIDEISIEQFRTLLQHAKQTMASRTNGKTVYVSPVDSTYGKLLTFATFAEMTGVLYDYRVFRTLAEAFEWLRHP